MKDNPVSKMFNNLTKNQKMSILNLLSVIAFSDGEGTNPDREMEELNSYINILDVHQGECQAYMNNYGLERMIQDLKSLSEKTHQFLVICAWDLIICDGRVNEDELTITVQLFDALGISEEKFMSTIKKSQAFMTDLLKN
jgi:uncharacterized tellurite resistance protein B-like protein